MLKALVNKQQVMVNKQHYYADNVFLYFFNGRIQVIGLP